MLRLFLPDEAWARPERDHVPEPCDVAPTSEVLAALGKELTDWQRCGDCVATHRAELRVQGTCFTAYRVYC